MPAPTKALDEEEAAYLEGVRQREETRERRRAQEEERELAAFGAYICFHSVIVHFNSIQSLCASDLFHISIPPDSLTHTYTTSHRPREP